MGVLLPRGSISSFLSSKDKGYSFELRQEKRRKTKGRTSCSPTWSAPKRWAVVAHGPTGLGPGSGPHRLLPVRSGWWAGGTFTL